MSVAFYNHSNKCLWYKLIVLALTFLFLTRDIAVAATLNNNQIGYIKNLTLRSLHELCNQGSVELCENSLHYVYIAITEGYVDDFWKKMWQRNPHCRDIKSTEEFKMLLNAYYPSQPGLWDASAAIGIQVFLVDYMSCGH